MKNNRLLSRYVQRSEASSVFFARGYYFIVLYSCVAPLFF